MSHEIKGRLIVINDTQTFPSGFTKREFVIETEGDKYPQKIKLELIKEKCALIGSYAIGTELTVSFNVNGNEYNGKYYVALQAWKIEGEKSQAASRPATQNGAKPPIAAMNDSLDEDDSIPF